MATPYMGQGGYSVDWNQPGMFAPAGGASQPYAGQAPGGFKPFMGDMSKSGTGTGVSYADMMARNPGLAGQAGSLAVPYSGGGFQPNTANAMGSPAGEFASAGQGMNEGWGGGSFFGGGSPGSAGPSAGYGGYSSGGSGNPNLSGMADDIARRNRLGLEQAFMARRSHAIGVGGLGGDRQKVAEGQDTVQALDNMTGQLANLYGNQWNQDQTRGLQKYGMDQNYDINSQNTRNSFYLGNRGLDQSGARLGADLWNSGQNGEWDPLKNASSVYSPYTGLGTTSQGGGGADWQQILGGVLGGSQLGKNFGWW